MPRRSSSGRSGGYGRSTGGGYRSYNTGRASPRPNYSNTRTTQSTTTPQSQRTSMPFVPQRGIGLGGAMATGMAFGGGSAIGHSIIGGLMGNRGGHGEMANTQNSQNTQIDPYSSSQQQEINKNPCFELGQKFIECLKENQSEISKCQNIMTDLNYCQKSMI